MSSSKPARRINWIALVVLAFGMGACGECRARMKMNEANQKYADGDFVEAADLYEEALKTTSLPVGHHNAGICNYRLVRAGDKSAQNNERVDRAVMHFRKYLASKPSPKDVAEIQSILTKMWIQADRIPEAIAFWKEQLAEKPNQPDIEWKIGALHNNAGQWRDAIAWWRKAADHAPSLEDKSYYLLESAKVVRFQLMSAKPKPVGLEALELSDVGLATVREALALNAPAKTKYELGIEAQRLFSLRSYVHQASWAWAAEQASFLEYQAITKDFEAKAKAEAEAESKRKAAQDAAGPPAGDPSK